MRNKFFKNYPISLIIAVSCVAIIIILVISIFVATYTNYNKNTVDAVNTQTQEFSTQIVYNYESYISTVIETSNVLQVEMNRFDLYDSNEAVSFSNYLREAIAFKSDFMGVSLYGHNAACIVSDDASQIGSSASGSEWYDNAIRDTTVHFFTVLEDADSGNYILIVSKYVSFNFGAKSGVLRMTVSFDKFVDIVKKSNLGQNGHITIVDPFYKVVYTSGAFIAEDQSVIRGIILGSDNIKLAGHNMNVTVETLENTKWRICIFINVDKLAEIEHNFLLSLITVSAVVLGIGIVVILYVSRIITKPLKALENAMREIENSDYFKAKDVDISASKEVASLTHSFNNMMRRLNSLMDKVIEEKNAQRRSELKALQNQINPHFLYNTLDSLVWLIQQNENEKAENMVVALAKLFRISISKGEQVISVRQELEHVKSYLLIQSMRYAGKFDYSISADEGVSELTTMKLILQPAVENAIYHGLKNTADKGLISIKAESENGYLMFTVSDNGYGMKSETVESLMASLSSPDTSNGVGLKNIYQRIMMYYNGDASMEIKSVLDVGTQVIIKEKIL